MFKFVSFLSLHGGRLEIVGRQSTTKSPVEKHSLLLLTFTARQYVWDVWGVWGYVWGVWGEGAWFA